MPFLNSRYSGYSKRDFGLVELHYDEGEHSVLFREPPFRPYCFVKASDIDKIPTNIKESYTIEEGNFVTYKHEDAIKIMADVPKSIRVFRDKVNPLGIEVFEGDIPYARRMMIDEGKFVENPKKILYWDIEVDSRAEFPKHENPYQRIILIAGIDNEGKRFAFCEDDEKKIICDFIDLKSRYAATCGWFTSGFDIPYLLARARNLGLKIDNFGFPDYDLLKIYKRFFKRKQQSYALSAVISKICEREIEDWGQEGTVSKMYELFKSNKKELIKYCSKQIEAVKDINEKLQLIDMWCQICKSAYLIPYAARTGGIKERSELPGNSKIIDNLILHKALELSNNGSSRMVFPSKNYDSADNASYIGGYVKSPIPGIWNDVIDIDAAQQYPAIIKSFNIGIDTYCESKEEGNIIAKHGSFKQEPRSILAQIVKTLSDQRYEAKRERNKYHPEDPMYDIWDKIQFGKKFITNSVYGIAGFPGSRYFKREIAENITCYARAILHYAEKYMSEDYTSLYSDTDSIFMHPKFEYKDIDELLEVTSEKLKLLNASLTNAIVTQWNVPKSQIEINFEYDTVFRKLYLTSKKKCYAGKVIWQNGKFIEPYTFIRGFETVRSSTLMFSREFQSDTFEWLLEGSTIKDIIQKKKVIREKFMSGEYDEKLYFLVGLGKPISEYDTETSQVKAAKKMMKQNIQVRVGDKIKFVRGANGRIILPGEEIHHSDRKFIWKTYVEPVFKRLDICETQQLTLNT